MRGLILLGCLLLGVGLSSCQCSEKPDIGPVEEASVAWVQAPLA